MADLELSRLIELQKLALRLRSVQRITYNPNDGYENDVEHSYSLAFLTWLMVPYVAPQLDFYRLQTYALAHDLVEVYAGDTFSFADARQIASKPARESAAIDRLADEFADFPQLGAAMRDYSRLADEEARFIYALDKLQPIILNYLDGGRVWRENHISFERMFTNRLGKSAVHPAVHRYVIAMAELLVRQPDLFPSSFETQLAGPMAA